MGDVDYGIMYYMETLSFCMVLLLLIAGSVILHRKNRSFSSWMISIGLNIAILAGLFGRVIFAWFTSGSLIISADDKYWHESLFWDQVALYVQIAGSVMAASGYVFFVNKHVKTSL